MKCKLLIYDITEVKERLNFIRDCEEFLNKSYMDNPIKYNKPSKTYLVGYYFIRRCDKWLQSLQWIDLNKPEDCSLIIFRHNLLHRKAINFELKRLNPIKSIDLSNTIEPLITYHKEIKRLVIKSINKSDNPGLWLKKFMRLREFYETTSGIRPRLSVNFKERPDLKKSFRTRYVKDISFISIKLKNLSKDDMIIDIFNHKNKHIRKMLLSDLPETYHQYFFECIYNSLDEISKEKYNKKVWNKCY